MTYPIGQKKPNAWGLYDMHGNVVEWCADYGPNQDYYRASPSNDPIGPLTGYGHVIRGGDWNLDPTTCRSAFRHGHWFGHRGGDNGFRVAVEIVPKPSLAPASIDDPFIKEVAALPAEEQVVRVVAKLKELNPGYDGKHWRSIQNGQVTKLVIFNTTVKDIMPLRAFVNLKELKCGGGQEGQSPLADITPLKDLPLEQLWIVRCEVSDLSPLHGVPLKSLHCGGNVTDITPLQGMPLEFLEITWGQVSDLSPLRGMRLTGLWCFFTKVTDLSPIKDMPLKELRCSFDPKRDTEILRSIKTLETINGVPVAEFWRQVEAGKIPNPRTGFRN
jgi:hypothetical protein